MKAKVVATLSFVGLMGVFNQPAVADSKSAKPVISNEAKALKSFNKIVDDFSKFYATNPKLVKRELSSDYTSKNAGLVYVVCQQVLKNIKFDAQKTNSLVSPFIGYIDIQNIKTCNGHCGDAFFRDVKMNDKEPIGYSTLDMALDMADVKSCFESLNSYTDRYEFVYQNDKWVLKNILSLNKGEFSQNYFMTAVLGIRSGGRFLLVHEPKALNYNKNWLFLVKPYLSE